jgi:phenylacetate-CoA ligase
MAQLLAYGRIQMEWAGHSIFDKGVQISGDEKPYNYQLFGRTLVLSSFCMNDEYLPIFIKKIQKLKPKYIRGYPSALTNLARFIKKNNIESFPSVKSIMCYAETLYDWQREFLEKIFKCHVFNHYGLRESVAIGGTCVHSDYFHMFPEYGIIELIGKNGKPVKKEDEIGEIVGTGFHTSIFPFIRYRTGDLAVYTKKKCICGINYPLLKKIEGREQELVVLKSKQLMPLTGIYGLVEMSSPNIKEYQYYQDKEGEILLNIVKTKDFSEKDSKEIMKKFKKRFGNELNLNIGFVDDIPLTKRGKHKLLIQKLRTKFAP